MSLLKSHYIHSDATQFNNYYICESQHLQSWRIQRLNSKFILVRIRNTDHVLRARWGDDIKIPWLKYGNVVGRGGGGREREEGWWVGGKMGVLQCSVGKIGGGAVTLQQQRAALTIPMANSNKQEGHINMTAATSPISKFSSRSKNLFYSIKPSFSWNEKQKAQWFSTHSCL